MTNFEKWKNSITAKDLTDTKHRCACFLDGACRFCPADKFCQKGSSDGSTCADIFLKWANADADEGICGIDQGGQNGDERVVVTRLDGDVVSNETVREKDNDGANEVPGVEGWYDELLALAKKDRDLAHIMRLEREMRERDEAGGAK